MSILIRGMDMPKECRACPMITYMNCGDTRCGAVGKLLAEDYMAIQFEGRADCCPLVEIPVHGRLIDADRATAESLKRTGKRLLAIDTAQTVIEAEGGENHEKSRTNNL